VIHDTSLGCIEIGSQLRCPWAGWEKRGVERNVWGKSRESAADMGEISQKAAGLCGGLWVPRYITGLTRVLKSAAGAL